jgi:hypothetical protein
LEEEPGAQ